MSTRTLDPLPPAGPEASPGFHLWHASLAWKAEVTAALAPHELTSTQFFLLGAISWRLRTNEDPPTQAEVARLSGLDPMTTSQVVRALASAGLVRRSADRKDSRAWRLSLTDAGQDKVKLAAAAVREVDRRFFGPLGEARGQLVQSLRELRRSSEER